MISRWLSSSNLTDDKTAFNKPMVHWCHTVCGPVGNCGGSHQKDQSSFNSLKWLRSQGASLGGFVVHTGEYVNCIQIIGNQEQLDLGMLAGEGYKVLISSALTVLELVSGGGGGGGEREGQKAKRKWGGQSLVQRNRA